MADEVMFTKVKARSCNRLYAYAKNLEQLCEACGVKVGDHQTPLSLRGVVAMVEEASKPKQ